MTDQESRDLIAGQARLEQKMDDMYSRLFGNGQPGVVQHLYTQTEDLSKRVGSVENKQWWMSGVGTGLGAVLGMFLGKFGL